MLKGDTGAKRTWFYENGAFVAAALAAVLWHVVLSTNVGDDMVYFKTLLDGNSSLGEILAHRYETWSSRMVIEAVLIPLVHCPLLWKILDIVIFTSLPVLLCGLLGVTGRGRWFVTGLVLLYPFADMGIRRMDCDDDQLSLAALGRSGDRHGVKAASLRQKSAGVGGGSCVSGVCLCGQPGTGCGAAASAAWHGSAALYLGKAYETAASLCIVRHRYYFPHIYFQLSGKCNPERAGDGGENAGVC